jgi:hypothetical protein
MFFDAMNSARVVELASKTSIVLNAELLVNPGKGVGPRADNCRKNHPAEEIIELVKVKNL